MNPFQEGADYLDKLIADRDRWKALAERMAEAHKKIVTHYEFNYPMLIRDAPEISTSYRFSKQALSDYEAAQK